MSAISFRNGFLFSGIILGFLGSYSVAHSDELLPTMETYAEGRDWTVVTEVEPKTCKLFVGNTSHVLIFGSFRPGGVLKYSVMVKDEDWIPPVRPIEYNIGNESRAIFSMLGRGFKSEGPGGFVIIGLFSEKILRAISASKLLYVRSDGAADRHYDLNGAGDGFRRFFDCLKDAGNTKVPTAPAPRKHRAN